MTDPTLAVAYLCNRYPAISHTFVMREVLALRRRGARVRTISIRRSDPAHLRAAEDRREFETTHALLPVKPWTVVAVHAATFARAPWGYLSTLAYALRLGRRTAGGRLWQLFYFAEAVLAWDRCRRDGLAHVHAHFTTPTADVALLAARLGAPGPTSFSFSAHGTDITAADQRLLAEKVRRARYVVCVSYFGRSQLMSTVEEEHWQKIRVVRCGLDLERFDAPPRDQRRDGPLEILSVGRLHPVKGHSVLLDALALLADSSTPARLTFVGDGPRRAALERRVHELGLEDSVRFEGDIGQDEIRGYYAAADVLCLPSFGEGIPVVLMEAMATRLPVVASRIMGIPELVEDGVGGLLVEPGRPDRLAAALRRLAVDPELGASLGEGGRAKVVADHDGARTADDLWSVMRHALEVGDSPAADAGHHREPAPAAQAEPS